MVKEILVTWEPNHLWESCTSRVYVPQDVTDIDEYLAKNYIHAYKRWELVSE